MTMKAPRLRPGDAVGIVSPSWGGASLFPHRLERGVQQLEALGFKVKIGAHARNRLGFVSDTPQNRAADIHAMFVDPDVRAIFSAIGGDHSCHLFPHLDFDLIRAHPKLFVGYSDTHILSVAIWKITGLVTFTGPGVLTDLAEYPSLYDYTRESLLKTLTQAEPPGSLEPSPWWTEEFLDWSEKKDLERPRARQPSTGWVWLKAGQREPSEGVLVGGCLESLQHLRSTRFWPDWEQAIFFFETSEAKPSPATVDGILMDYDNMGVLEELNGLLVGRAMSYSDAEKEALADMLLERTHGYSFPIVMNLDFGHTAPQLTLPIGCRARIDAARRALEISEAAVS
jgi:muramoyltetrapeptide carboxypeptidase LdcA involved in peptidoglycan recycling